MKGLVASLSSSIFMIGFGMIALTSVYNWIDFTEGKTAKYSIEELKQKLIAQSDLFASHNAVYEKVGEEKWETTIKPDFMNELLTSVIADTGNPMPEEDEVLNWVHEHSDQVKAMMERYGNVLQKVEKENQETFPAK